MIENRSAFEALDAFDRGEILWTISMGELGPGYEQALQLAALEIIRGWRASGVVANLADESDKNKKHVREVLDGLLHEAVKRVDLGLSGAQAGAAIWLAARALRYGWDEMVKRGCVEEPDRKTMISNHWPGAKLDGAEAK